MVELQHSATPQALYAYLAINPEASVTAFDDPMFKPVKDAVKAALNQDQAGLCAYCERQLVATAGQVDHIKPKGGKHGRPELCFSYTNFAHSCISDKTCGQMKSAGLLPIEPGPGCNQQWVYSTTDASIQPTSSLTRTQRHPVQQTLDMLGLNHDAALVQERKHWFAQVLTVLQEAPSEIDNFLRIAPFRHIFGTAL